MPLIALRSNLVIEVRAYGHLEGLTTWTDAEIERRLDRSYRRLCAMLDQARGHELEKNECYAHLAPGVRRIVLPTDFYQLRGVLLQRAKSQGILL